MDAMHAVIEHTKQHLTAEVARYPHTTEEVQRALEKMAAQAAAAAAAMEARQRAFEGEAAAAAAAEVVALRERAELEASQVREREREREREELVGSNGRWKRPCLQTAHMTI
jgi:predicted  nucleic acid-binding Zn-ribbon protein